MLKNQNCNFEVTNLCFRLYNAYRTCNDLTILAIQYLLKERTTFTPTSSRLAFNTVEKYEVLGGPSVLVLVNTLARDAFSLQIVAVNNSQELQVRIGISIHRTVYIVQFVYALFECYFINKY